MDAVTGTDPVVGLLGPVVVRVDDRVVTPPSATQRRLLAALALEPGRSASTDRLGDVLGVSVGAVRTTVARTRRLVEDAWLATRAGGYELRATTDVEHFHGWLRGQADAPASRRVQLLETALSTVRGPPLEEFRDEAWARHATRRLDELVALAREDHADALLDLGRAGEAVAALEELVARAPLRDRARLLLVEALATEGRQGDALATYRDYHRLLDTRLGTVPSAALQSLQARVAAGEPVARRHRGAPPGGREGERRLVALVALADVPAAGRADVEAVLEAAGARIQASSNLAVVAVLGTAAGAEQATRTAARLAAHACAPGGVAAGGVALVDSRRVELVDGDVPTMDVARMVTTVLGRSGRDAGAVLLTDEAVRVAGLDAQCRPEPDAQGLLRLVGPVDRNDRTHVPLVGRDAELAFALAELERLADGRGRVLSVIGAPGIGKTRLLEAVRAASAGDVRWVVLAARPADRDVPFGLLAAADTTGASADGGGDAEQVVAPVRALVPSGATPGTAPGATRESLLVAASDWLARAAANGPLALAVEDLHFVDDDSRQVVARWAHEVADLPVALVVTTRPGPELPWLAEPGHRLVTLGPLEPRDAAALARALTGPVDDAVVERVVDDSDGVPLFVVELASAIEHERPTGVPPTLAELLQATLDRMARGAERVVRVLAVADHHVGLDVLATAADLPGDRTRALAEDGVRLGLLRRRSVAGEEQYEMAHSLHAAAVCDGLQDDDLASLHRRLAEALTAVGGADDARLARYWERAGDLRRAATCWTVAAELALVRGSPVTAERLLGHARELLDAAGDGADVDARVQVRLREAHAAEMARGWRAPGVEDLLAEAREIASSAGATESVLDLLLRSSLVAQRAGRTTEAAAIARRLDEEARALGTADAQARADLAMASAELNTGRPLVALARARAALHASDDEGAPVLGPYERVQALAFVALATVVGVANPDEACGPVLEQLDDASTDEDPAMSLVAHLARLHLLEVLGRLDAAGQVAQAMFERATRFEIAPMASMALCGIGYVRGMQGDPDGLELHARGMAEMAASGMVQGRVKYLNQRAELCLVHGRHEEARAALDEALSREELLRFSHGAAVAWWLRARLALAEHDRAGARRCVERGLEIADGTLPLAARHLRELRAALDPQGGGDGHGSQ